MSLPPWTGPDAPPLSELPSLNALEAFDAMRVFIAAYWERGGRASDDLAVLLSSVERNTTMFADGGPIDPAQWFDWLEAIAAVKERDV